MPKTKWPQTVQSYAEKRGIRYEKRGGINPREAPTALLVGGENRLTGELADGFWGSSCDALPRREGVPLFRRTVPGAVLAKAYMPDLGDVISAFNVESVEKRPGDMLAQRFARKVEFESIAFNRRFLVTVPSDYDAIALRELIGPAFLDWATGMDRQVEFGISDRQLWFMWSLRERTSDELDAALTNAGQLFRRLRHEMYESGIALYPPGPWHAGLEHFPERKATRPT